MKALKFFVTMAVLVAAMSPAAADPPAKPMPANAAGVLAHVEGTVEYWPAGGKEWRPAQAGQCLGPGDKLRTQRNSRMEVQMPDGSVQRYFELTTVELDTPPPPQAPGPNIRRGRMFMFNRSQQTQARFGTPRVSGAIRGTEFHVRVEEDGTTEISLLDGQVDLSNEQGRLALNTGEQAVVEPGGAPRKTAMLEAHNIIQWCLYYPGVLCLEDLALDPAETTALRESLEAYRQGDLTGALAKYPAAHQPASDAGKVYQAALLLSVGKSEEAEKILQSAASQPSQPGRLAQALLRVIACTRNPGSGMPPTTGAAAAGRLATEWLADSYEAQSASQLETARQAAQSATQAAPQGGFAWARLAELEFSFGRTTAAKAALAKALALAPRQAQAQALQGFTFSAQNRWQEALAAFEKAIALDGALASGWLGRGLVKIHLGQAEEGRKDLVMAAALEPQRSLLRSYLGKAFSQVGDRVHATRELELAKRLDPADPTPHLYSALMLQTQNRINAAVSDLERSQELNDNRSVYRSRLLLDQDRAVRSANLASIYRDAGMEDFGSREASRAVQSDYANYSAHLFLANSFADLQSAHGVNLRYETAATAEFLIANLLAPPGAGVLSRGISQQEYSRFFEQRRFGLANSTEYLSRGAWRQGTVQYGEFDDFSYSLDGFYASDHGTRNNGDLEQWSLSAQAKARVTREDTLYFQAICAETQEGDLVQYYNQANANTGVRLKDRQIPLLLGGWRHEWSPESTTLLLFARLADDLRQTDPAQSPLLGLGVAGGFIPLGFGANNFNYRSRLEVYSFEAQQLWQRHNHSLIAGARGQFGEFSTRSFQFNPRVSVGSFAPNGVVSDQDLVNDFSRLTLYGYYNWEIADPLLLTAGVSYDRVLMPQNYRNPPLSNLGETRGQVSPKAGLIWRPWKAGTLRAGYTRSLGGVSSDQSVRLEPTQVAGFNQAYRSLIPESIAGSAAAPKFEIASLGLDHHFPTRTYLSADTEWLHSKVERILGAYDLLAFPAGAYEIRERVAYDERALTLSARQLLGEEWSLGARYRFGEVRLKDQFDQIPGMVNRPEATLQQLNLHALFNHRCGFFAQAEALWHRQSNRGYTTPMPGDNFWQVNFYAGYRFPRRSAEVLVGLLNAGDQDYRLNPLNLHAELPRERTLAASLRFHF